MGWAGEGGRQAAKGVSAAVVACLSSEDSPAPSSKGDPLLKHFSQTEQSPVPSVLTPGAQPVVFTKKPSRGKGNKVRTRPLPTFHIKRRTNFKKGPMLKRVSVNASSVTCAPSGDQSGNRPTLFPAENTVVRDINIFGLNKVGKNVLSPTLSIDRGLSPVISQANGDAFQCITVDSPNSDVVHTLAMNSCSISNKCVLGPQRSLNSPPLLNMPTQMGKDQATALKTFEGQGQWVWKRQEITDGSRIQCLQQNSKFSAAKSGVLQSGEGKILPGTNKGSKSAPPRLPTSCNDRSKKTGTFLVNFPTPIDVERLEHFKKVVNSKEFDGGIGDGG
ncbi:uncharacterized protein LOC144763398 [Lissotriton helveticus]